LSCTICNVRKERRFCLALHERICPQCCGEQREATIDCPSECSYLRQAREHEKPRRLEDLPAEELFSGINLTETFVREQEALVAGIVHTITELSQADRSLNDREVIGGLVNLVKSYQTLVSSGLVYDQAVPNLAEQALTERLRKLITEYRELEHRHLGYAKLKDSDVLKTLVFVLRLAHTHTSGRPRSRAFLDAMKEQFPSRRPDASVGTESGSRIILP
jgi:hypothetical protein